LHDRGAEKGDYTWPVRCASRFAFIRRRSRSGGIGLGTEPRSRGPPWPCSFRASAPACGACAQRSRSEKRNPGPFVEAGPSARTSAGGVGPWGPHWPHPGASAALAHDAVASSDRIPLVANAHLPRLGPIMGHRRARGRGGIVRLGRARWEGRRPRPRKPEVRPGKKKTRPDEWLIIFPGSEARAAGRQGHRHRRSENGRFPRPGRVRACVDSVGSIRFGGVIGWPNNNGGLLSWVFFFAGSARYGASRPAPEEWGWVRTSPRAVS